jgi:hypothetical protein
MEKGSMTPDEAGEGSQLQDEQLTTTVNELVAEFKSLVSKSSRTVLEIAMTIYKVEAELSESDRQAFYDEVGLDGSGSTVRKLKIIGEKGTRFKPFHGVLPNTWTTLYELAKMEDHEFQRVVNSGVLRPFCSLKEIHGALGKKEPSKSGFRVFVDLSTLGTRIRQAEFALRLKQLVDEYELELSAPKHEDDLSSLLDELVETQMAA